MAEATAMYHQVVSHDYSPPTRERIAEWQRLQQQVIYPGIDDPDAGNVYKDLHFPEGVLNITRKKLKVRPHQSLHLARKLKKLENAGKPVLLLLL